MPDTIPTVWDRVNLGKWAIPVCQLPCVAAGMLSTPSLTFDKYDLQFHGQIQRTTYFDTPDFDLRKARCKGAQYVTIRVRCYEGSDGEAYTLSAKTEGAKYRMMIEPALAEALTTGQDVGRLLASLLPADVQARLLDLAGDQPLQAVVCVQYRRYAVEDDQSRLTLDTEIEADNGKRLHYGVLEWKSSDDDADLPTSIAALPLRPLKLSKFLWATGV